MRDTKFLFQQLRDAGQRNSGLGLIIEQNVCRKRGHAGSDRPDMQVMNLFRLIKKDYPDWNPPAPVKDTETQSQMLVRLSVIPA